MTARAAGVEQDVVRPVITVHQDATDPILILDASQRRIDRVDASQHLAAGAQDLISLVSIDQLLAMNPGHKAHAQAVNAMKDHRWDREPDRKPAHRRGLESKL